MDNEQVIKMLPLLRKLKEKTNMGFNKYHGRQTVLILKLFIYSNWLCCQTVRFIVEKVIANFSILTIPRGS